KLKNPPQLRWRIRQDDYLITQLTGSKSRKPNASKCAILSELTRNYNWCIYLAPEIYFAFRGRLVSLLVLLHSGVSPMPLLPQESTYISDRKSTRLNSSHVSISYAVFCLKKKK